MKIKAHPTDYAGVRFRSRTEAKWAAFFDLMAWRWDYEPLDLEGDELHVGYVPDFVLHLAAPIAVEVKPLLWSGTDEEESLIAAARSRMSTWTGEALILGSGIRIEDGVSFLGELREGDSWQRAFTFRCLDCGRPSFAHDSMSWHCRVTGCHDGDHHIDRDDWDPVGDLRAASNRVQWRAA